MTKRITTERAVEIATSWGSMMTSADPGAIMYSLPPLADEDHRHKLLTHIDNLIRGEPSDQDERIAELQALRHWVSTATVPIDNPFLEGYVEAALWASTAYGVVEEDGSDDRSFQTLGYTAHDLHPDSYRKMIVDCMDFLLSNGTDLARFAEITKREPYHLGHDFFLTRERHGTGFWDRGAGEVGDRLTTESQGYGSVDLYVGDDGHVHAS